MAVAITRRRRSPCSRAVVVRAMSFRSNGELTEADREDLADRLYEAWAELRKIAIGGRGHLVDIYLEAARVIRPRRDAP